MRINLFIGLTLCLFNIYMHTNGWSQDPAPSIDKQALEPWEKQELLSKASEARLKAYAPYSNFFVGAALLGTDGKIYQGANVENASYGVTCCAERVALFKAVTEGTKDFKAIAIVVPGGGSPCGVCRQALNEFSPSLPVILGDEEGNIVSETTLLDLLPDAFGPHNLQKAALKTKK